MIKLSGLKNVRERINETKRSRDLANMKNVLGVDSDGAREWEYLKDPILQLEWVKDQFQSDFKAIKEALTSEFATDDTLHEIISAIDSAMEEK